MFGIFKTIENQLEQYLKYCHCEMKIHFNLHVVAIISRCYMKKEICIIRIMRQNKPSIVIDEIKQKKLL